MEHPWSEGNRHARAHATSAHARRDESVLDDRRHLPARGNAKSHSRRGRDRDGLRPRSLNEENLPLGPRGQAQRAVVDPKIAGRTGKTRPATDPLPNCRIRLWYKGKYSALASAEGARGDRRPSRHIG